MDYYDYAITKMVFEMQSIALITLHNRLKRTNISKTTIRRKIKKLKNLGIIQTNGKNPIILNINPNKIKDVSEIVERGKITYNVIG